MASVKDPMPSSKRASNDNGRSRSTSDASKPIPLEANLQLLDLVEQNPQLTQADLAAHLGVAVGTVNWYLRRMIGKGYIKIRRMERKRLAYLITPRGLAQKSRLSLRYARASLKLYRETRDRTIELLGQSRKAGYDCVILQGDGDVAEICRLTCLDQNVRVFQSAQRPAIPILSIDGMRIELELPDRPPAGAASVRGVAPA